MQSVEEMEVSPSLPTLRLNSKGHDVKYLQGFLKYYGYSVEIDGVFGAKTEAAVKQFQKSRSLKVDGIVGSKTWDKLIDGYC